MAGAKEIRSKIASIKNTQKITKAMQMVAASKMRKAQDRMRSARPYADKIREVIGHLRQANPDYKHPYLIERPVKSTGIIIISTDRGLCGSLNINLFKSALLAIREAQSRGETVHLCLVGTKALQFFRRLNTVSVSASVTNLGDRPVQVGSHYHFMETNASLKFDRGKAYGKRLDIPAGAAVRFEPGDTKTVHLVDIAGERIIRGGNNLGDGPANDAGRSAAMQRVHDLDFAHEDA